MKQTANTKTQIRQSVRRNVANVATLVRTNGKDPIEREAAAEIERELATDTLPTLEQIDGNRVFEVMIEFPDAHEGVAIIGERLFSYKTTGHVVKEITPQDALCEWRRLEQFQEKISGDGTHDWDGRDRFLKLLADLLPGTLDGHKVELPAMTVNLPTLDMGTFAEIAARKGITIPEAIRLFLESGALGDDLTEFSASL